MSAASMQRRNSKLKTKVEIRMSCVGYASGTYEEAPGFRPGPRMFEYQALICTRFQHGFHRFELHRPTTMMIKTTALSGNQVVVA
jgi:hypothetical protein